MPSFYCPHCGAESLPDLVLGAVASNIRLRPFYFPIAPYWKASEVERRIKNMGTP